ncbi:MAG: GMC family oxidoreductase N-terminal domain-containing protein [Oligoflexales bacterium]
MQWDAIIIGSGISGSFFARELTEAGLRCLILESGLAYTPRTYPKHELEMNSHMFWDGGAEFNSDMNLALLRPKVVGGGSVINGGLLDRFDQMAWELFTEDSGISFFNSKSIDPYYKKVLNQIHTETIPEKYANKNASIFKEGLKSQGYKYGSLLRAQKNCQYQDGNDCIECLGGCKIGSKQSMLDSVLGEALSSHSWLYTGFTVSNIKHYQDHVTVQGRNSLGHTEEFTAPRLILAAGSIGNTKILQSSHFNKKIKSIGHHFYNHPQWLTLARYAEKIRSFEGPLQTYKSNDPQFREKGFKLENVFAGPVALSMIIPKHGLNHQEWMTHLSHTACIEVAIRDTTPGEIKTHRGKVTILKNISNEDLKKRNEGFKIIDKIYHESGCLQTTKSDMAISLHLMGGCRIGSDDQQSVVNENFQLHHHKNIFCADSSIFPCAPGINPSLTVMALSSMASQSVIRSFS